MTAPPDAPNPRIDELFARLAERPDDDRVFAELEQELRAAGRHLHLAGAYEVRLQSLAAPEERSKLLVTLSEILDSDLRAPRAALKRLKEARGLTPQSPVVLARLRQLLVRQGDPMAALQIAEDEESLELPAAERAALLVETAQLWTVLGESNEVRSRLQEALRLDPECSRAEHELALLDAAGPDETQAAEPGAPVETFDSRSEDSTSSDSADTDSADTDSTDTQASTAPVELTASEPMPAADPIPSSTPIPDSVGMAEVPDPARDLPEVAIPVEACEAPEGSDTQDLRSPDLPTKDPLGEAEPPAEASEQIDIHALELQADACAQSGDLAGWVSALEAIDHAAGPSYERALQLCELHELSGDAERAPKPLESWFESHADDAAGLSALDRCYQRLERHEDRRDVLERFLRIPRSPSEGSRIALALGELLSGPLADPSGAERMFKHALKLVPEDDAALRSLGQLLLDAGRHDDWIEGLSDAARLLGRGGIAAERLCRAGEHARRQGQFTRARTLLVEALELDPDCTDAIDGLRGLHAETADPKAQLAACEAELRRAESSERRAALWRELCDLAETAGDRERAREAAANWAQFDASAEPLRTLAKLSRETGDENREREALESLEGCTENEEERAACRQRLGELFESQPGPMGIPNAIRWYRAAVELSPMGPARRRLIQLWKEAGRTAEIARLLEHEIETGIASDPTEARLELAQVWMDADCPDRAAAILLPWFFRDPSEDRVADRLEEILTRTQDVESQVSVLDLRMRSAGDTAARLGPAVRLGTLYLDRLGRPADAIAVLREFVESDPSGPARELYERALVAGGSIDDQIDWYRQQVEQQNDPELELALRMQLAGLYAEADRLADAIECLEAAETLEVAGVAEQTARPLLHLLDRSGEPERTLGRLEELASVARTARARAAFVLERARILLDLERPDEAMRELDRLPRAVALRPSEWRLVCDLATRGKDGPRLREALQTLIEVLAPGRERQALYLALADLYLGDDERVHDPERGEEILYALVEDAEFHQLAAERLGELLNQTGRRRARVDLLARRLEEPGLEANVRRVLVAEYAELNLALGDAASARTVLETERERGGPEARLDRLLCDALGMLGAYDAQSDLYRERTLSASGAERSQWLRWWLTAQETAEAPAKSRLEVIERWLAFVGSDPELEQRRIALLRETGQLESLAHALEDLLATDARLTEGRQLAIIRELLRTYEGPLQLPQRALRLCERELPRHPELRVEARRLAERLGDGESERAHLDALLRDAAADHPSTPGWNRRLALLLVSQGRSDEARDALRRALEDFPHDRDVLRALEPIERSSLTPARLLELQEQRYPLESGPARQQLVREAFSTAEQLCDAMTALTWVRRWRLEESPPIDTLRRWVSLERAVGDPAGLHEALGALAEATPDPEGRGARIAERAALYAERGEIRLAEETYAKAVDTAPLHAVPWLFELVRLAERRSDTDRTLELLEQISHHPEASAGDRGRALLRKVELLFAQPDRRAEAAADLERQLGQDADSDRATRIDHLRKLLELYDALGESPAWCAIAERLIPLLDSEASTELRRELARRWEQLATREPTIGLWQSILDRAPSDEEALAALVRLLDRSGDEEQRARVLETWAATRGTQGGELWMEAAELRFRRLGDVHGAKRAVEAALEIDPLAFACHALRAELCAAVQEFDGEEESLRVMLEAEPESESAPLRWLRVVELIHQRGGESAEIRNALDRALRATEPGDPLRIQVRRWLSHLGEWPAVAELLQEEVEHGDDHSVEALRELARVCTEELLDAEVACRAFEDLHRRTQLSPEDEERWARVLSGLERAPAALEHRERALIGFADRARGQDWYEQARLVLDQDASDHERARAACRRALELDPEHLEALELRVELDLALGDRAAERDGRLSLAAARDVPADAASELARASRLSLELGEPERAGELADRALQHHSGCIEALWCAGESADALSAHDRSEQAYGRLCKSIEEPIAAVLTAAQRAARAARALSRSAAASHYLDLALAKAPEDAATLCELLALCSELGHHERARECLETLLEHGKPDDDQRFDWQLELARACLELGDIESAAETLERAQSAKPLPEAEHSRLIDALEVLGETDRLLDQLERIEGDASRAEEICLRAARAEIAAERFDAARQRLELALETSPLQLELWRERASLVACLEGADAALRVIETAVALEWDDASAADLHWQASRWAGQAKDSPRAVHEAAETLDRAPTHREAALALARHLRERARPDGSEAATPATGWGEINSLAKALAPDIARLERALAGTEFSSAERGELQYTLGVAYAACCDWSPACAAYRTALQQTPKHDRAREAFADLAAYQADTQREGVEQQGTILQSEPTRAASWRALSHASERQGRPRAIETCRAVLCALGLADASQEPPAGASLLVAPEAASSPHALVSELLQALGELELLPVHQNAGAGADGALSTSLHRLTGGAFSLPDAVLERVLTQTSEELEASLADVPRLRRRRPRKAQRALSEAAPIDLGAWRVAALTQAAASELESGQHTLDALCLALIQAWPETAHLEVRTGEQRQAAIAACPPASQLLARIAHAVVDAI